MLLETYKNSVLEIHKVYSKLDGENLKRAAKKSATHSSDTLLTHIVFKGGRKSRAK